MTSLRHVIIQASASRLTDGLPMLTRMTLRSAGHNIDVVPLCDAFHNGLTDENGAAAVAIVDEEMSRRHREDLENGSFFEYIAKGHPLARLEASVRRGTDPRAGITSRRTSKRMAVQAAIKRYRREAAHVAS